MAPPPCLNPSCCPCPLPRSAADQCAANEWGEAECAANGGPFPGLSGSQAFIGNRFFAMSNMDRTAYVTWCALV